METLYFDNCCLNRPFNDQSQPRIHEESEAVLAIIARCRQGEWQWAASAVSLAEIAQTPDSSLRAKLGELIQFATSVSTVEAATFARADVLESMGLHRMDALHVAAAESVAAQVFLTVDDRLLRRCRRLASAVRVRVVNPVEWLRENANESD